MKLTVNGQQHDISSPPETPLIYVLRDELKLKGTKLACGLEQCGACAVLVDGTCEMSCVTPAASFEEKSIVTVEGLASNKVGASVQQAFVKEGAAQCGYCTSGLVVAAAALLSSDPHPDRETIKVALASHLCRCGSHAGVLRAVARAAGDQA